MCRRPCKHTTPPLFLLFVGIVYHQVNQRSSANNSSSWHNNKNKGIIARINHKKNNSALLETDYHEDSKKNYKNSADHRENNADPLVEKTRNNNIEARNNHLLLETNQNTNNNRTLLVETDHHENSLDTLVEETNNKTIYLLETNHQKLPCMSWSSPNFNLRPCHKGQKVLLRTQDETHMRQNMWRLRSNNYYCKAQSNVWSGWLCWFDILHLQGSQVTVQLVRSL